MLAWVSVCISRVPGNGFHARFVPVAVLFVLLALSTGAVPAERQRRPKVGDRVEASYMGRMEPGTITGFLPTGWPVISVDRAVADGMPPMPFPPNQVRLLSEPPKERTWMDSTGAFETKATLVAKDANSVSLKKPDGEVITVPIDKLSKRDQEYVKGQELPSASAGRQPAPLGFPGVESMLGPGVPGPDGFELPSLPTDFGQTPDTSEYDSLPMGNISGVETIAMTDPSSPWSYTPLTTPSFAPTSVIPVQLPLKSSPGSMVSENTLVVSYDGSAAALGLGDPFSQRTRLHVVDLAGNQVLASHELPSLGFVPKDVTPKGRFVVTAGSHMGQPGHVAFWKPSDGACQRVGGWRIPGPPTSGRLVDVRFVELQRAVTVNASGELVIWALRDGKAIATCHVVPQVGRAFNYDGRRMAAFTDGAIHLFDLAAGRDLAAIAVDGEPPARLAFSPNGAKLAGLKARQLLIWDLTTGKLSDEIVLQTTAETSSADWLDDRFVLVNQHDLVDTEEGMVYWRMSKEHSLNAVSIAPAGSSCYLFKDQRQATLFSFRLPLDQVAGAWKSLDKSSLFTFEPGPISIRMQGLPFSGTEQEEIRSSLTRQLQDSGFAVTQNAPMAFSLRVERGTTKQAEVRDFGDSHFDEPDAVVSYTPTTCRIELTRGETLLWSRSRVHSPVGMFHCKENESAQQAVNRICRPSAAFFSQIRLPKPGLLLPGGEDYLGASRLTARGLQ